MEKVRSSFNTEKRIKLVHGFERQILEIISFLRVFNNYQYKKREIQKKIRPLLLKEFKQELKTIKDNRDWLFKLPTVLTTMNQELINHNDSFRFPDSIILFEKWMDLGINALFPQVAFHFKFPGFMKNEKKRHIFQIIFSTSRGLGFPILFPPKFYGYTQKFMKYLDYLFGWMYNVNHWINQLIFRLERKLKTKRHHPGEFESVIISEYKDHLYKGIDTLFHGYFTNEPKKLGSFTTLNDALENLIFSYRIGDHAINIIKNNHLKSLEIPVLDYELLKEQYDIDFFSYVKKLMKVDKELIKQFVFYHKKRKETIRKLPLLDRIKFVLHESKRISIPGQKLPEKFEKIEIYHRHKHLVEKLRTLLWTTPLFTHTIHDPSRVKKIFQITIEKEEDNLEEYDRNSTNSIFFSFIKHYESQYEFQFVDEELTNSLEELRDHMAKMWLYFKERHFKFALKKINTLTDLSPLEQNYKFLIEDTVYKVIPIIAIYEIFNRPLSESVYPESVPQTKRIGAYIAKFLTSRYNVLGFNLIRFFNHLAFRNWSYYIKNNNLKKREFFQFVVKLPIWKHIPESLRDLLLKTRK
ncbi:MAG: hypothetical protein GF317_06550 [Candidatus Lokiarchaeota archaeon]|nr:hypothetical protein [Candidatus Lokiarchaeota archaeon]MBD3199373.1 hypothetical protein [Candidatus Lokiarchaeota archaeon]